MTRAVTSLYRPLPSIHYPPDLPVSLRRKEIAQAIQANQVVIVSGETGSGKTTQLPKICLELGRGQAGMIAHTQPRRLAATSVARRIAQELDTRLGDWVGYQIRFSEQAGESTAIKLMTDGILLAQSQRDPLLRQYDTIIIDEAHERSLNIDFLLGFLKQLLPKRPDLKLIITSATIDAQRFANHFSANGKPAPTLHVSGRLYPVDILYRPILSNSAAAERQNVVNPRLEPDDEQDLITAIIDAVHECWRFGRGDVLVFLPGEREIREAADALRNDLAAQADVLPLFARLSRADQEKIFSPISGRIRIVLATNVAETSLTVPGIRYVVDSGLARVKRYSWRNKVEQLHIERISQASANQRAGRCGRVGPGVCIRLYDEDDFKSRAEFTDPEILRSSLASVILRMKALGLQEIDHFPFVDAPHGRAIADGYHLLQELGALNEAQNLTRIGKSLARLPLDPRLARMLLAARDKDCLEEMLIIASALSTQDPRERPMEQREAAVQAHSPFRDPKSEFLSFIKLWRWIQENYQERSTQRQFVALLRKNFISPVRFREWRDVHTQLSDLVKEQRWRINGSEATYEQIHTALLTGLLGNIGTRTDDGKIWQGTRENRFLIHPGSTMVKKAGRWIMAAELVETSQLFARCVANIEPVWIENAARHLLRLSWNEPRWEKRSGQVVANERAVLYGLTIYSGRRIHYGRIDAKQARELFIRQGLVAADLLSPLPFLKHNLKLVTQIEKLEHQSRRPDILVDEALIFAFYDALIPQEVFQTASLERWYKTLKSHEQKKLFLSKEDLMRHDAAGITTDIFPKKIEWEGVEMALDYHFEPGSLRDGVTLAVPLLALNQIDARRCEWLVPGMLKEKVQLLLRSLPQRLRRHCVPLPDYAQGFFERWFNKAQQPDSGLLEAIAKDIHQQRGIRPVLTDFKPETLPAHLFMNFKVIDEHGRMLSGGRNLDQLKAEHQQAAQASFQKLAEKDRSAATVLAHENLTSWSFGPLPELLEIQRKGETFFGYPALVDKGQYCDLDVFDDPIQAQTIHKQGLLRLFRLSLREPLRFLEKNLYGLSRMGMLFLSLGSQDELRDQILDKAIELSCLSEAWPNDAASFEACCDQGRARLSLLAQEIARLVEQILLEWSASSKKIAQIKAHTESYNDMLENQARLIHKRFIAHTPLEQLRHFPRYLKAVQVRCDKLRSEPARDQRWMQEMAGIQTQYQRAVVSNKGKLPAGLEAFGWLLQELRVALFAQELRTPMPVSVKRLQRSWEALQR